MGLVTDEFDTVHAGALRSREAGVGGPGERAAVVDPLLDVADGVHLVRRRSVQKDEVDLVIAHIGLGHPSDLDRLAGGDRRDSSRQVDGTGGGV